MKVGLRVLTGSSLLTGAEAVNNGCLLLRNLIFARILSKEDFGIAATLGLVVALFELAGKMSIGQQIIQSPAGDETKFQRASHTSQALAGALSAAIILIFASPLARSFGMAAHKEAFLLLAIIPLCTGFSSLEPYRLMRHLRFMPLVLTDTGPQIMITLAAWPLAKWLQDYRVLLCVLLAKAFLSLVASHMVAVRPYRLSREPQISAKNLRFGWPLLATNFLIVGVFQGDRMLVASAYSLSDLGVYAAASTLAMAPTLAVLKISGPVALTILARAQDEKEKLQRYYSILSQALALLSTVFLTTTILGGETITRLLLGPKYREAAGLVAMLAAGQALRIIRGAPTAAALAKGDTINGMLSNAFRLLGVAFAVPIALSKFDLRWVAAAGGVGEFIALVGSAGRLWRRHGLPMSCCVIPAGLVLLVALGACLAKAAFDPSRFAAVVAVAVGGAAASVFVVGVAFGSLRRLALSLILELASNVKVALSGRRSRNAGCGTPATDIL